MGRRKKLVMVTNDDSIQSNGILELAQRVSKFADVVVVAPEAPQSATAMSLTFHKPLRVSRVEKPSLQCFAVSGSPGDCVMVGVNRLLPRRPDLVVSGVNLGDNNTYQDVLASGTVAAAMAAALAGIPAVAFSMEVPDDSMFALEYKQPDFSRAAEAASEITRDVLENGMPQGAELINVNFPGKMDASTEIVLTEIARRKYTDKVLVRKDPRGRPYYWLWGERLSDFPANSDAEAVIKKRLISITPVVISMTGPMTDSLDALRKRVTKRLRRRGPA